jgi:hypothetical protein
MDGSHHNYSHQLRLRGSGTVSAVPNREKLSSMCQPFCRHSAGTVDRAGAGYDAYFHDQVENEEMMDRFRQGQTAIVATSTLGMGIDVPDLHDIIHLGWPRALLDYGQESGRVGSRWACQRGGHYPPGTRTTSTMRSGEGTISQWPSLGYSGI